MRTGRRLGVGLAGLAVMAIGACGLDADGDPQAISTEDLPPGLIDPNPVATSTTLAESPTTTEVPVYFLVRDGDEERLQEVSREVPASDEPSDRLAALFTPPTQAEADEGLTSSIPADLVILDASQIDSETKELSVNLSSDLLTIEGAELAKAFAQIVYTATDHDDVSQVGFYVEGEPIPALDAEGVEREGAVTRADYRPWQPEL